MDASEILNDAAAWQAVDVLDCRIFLHACARTLSMTVCRRYYASPLLHHVLLSGLRANSTYFYQARRCDRPQGMFL